MSVNSDRNPKGSCQTKVCNLDGAILVYQQVGGLQVSVQDSSGVAENNALKASSWYHFLGCFHSKLTKTFLGHLAELVGPGLNQLRLHWLILRSTLGVHVLLQVHGQVLKNKIQLCFLVIKENCVLVSDIAQTCIKISFRLTILGCRSSFKRAISRIAVEGT